MSTNRSLLYIGAGILALVVLAVVAVLLAEGRGPASFPPGSPQDVMQRYLTAWDDRDYAAAYAYFSTGVQSRHSLERFEQEAAEFHGRRPGDDVDRAIYIDAADEDGDRATVHLTVEEYYGGGGDSYRSPREVLMVREADGWRIDQPLLGIEVRPFGDPL
jgi:hypothetical protein